MPEHVWVLAYIHKESATEDRPEKLWPQVMWRGFPTEEAARTYRRLIRGENDYQVCRVTLPKEF